MSFSGSKTGSTTVFAAETTSLKNPITFYKEVSGKYPSNAQIWWSMQRPPELGTTAPPKIYLEVFDPGLRYQVITGGIQAPQGHFVLNAFFRDRSAVSGVSNIPVETAGGQRPRAIAFFAGRVWYAGTHSVEFSADIYFSPIIERPEQVGECYQQYDPTSEELRDLLPSDGGVVRIPELSIVYHMESYGQNLLAFADNGLWKISGSEGVGFRADDYSVTKASGVPTISNLSFVMVEGVPVWWNRSSINAIAMDPNGQLVVKSLTDDTIKDFYDDIPEQSKFNAKGTYDPLTKTVQWVYRSTATDDIVEQFQYDRILAYDTRTNAWMPWSTAENTRVDILGLFSIAGEAVTQQTVDVVSGVAEDNVIAGADEVISVIEERTIVDSRVKYIVNVKEASDTPEPPDPEVPAEDFEIIANTDDVIAGADNVIITS